MHVANLSRSQVRPNPNQPRKVFDRDALVELADSIREVGLMQPIVVRKLAEDDYMIIAGERRYRACTMLALDELPCMVIEGISDEQMFILSTTENVARRDMTLVEEATAYSQIVGLGRDVAEVAKLFGKTEHYIQYRLDLLRLRADVLDLVGKGQISSKLAHELSKLTPDGQGAVLRKMADGQFKTDGDAMRYARVIKGYESQPGLTDELTLTVQQVVTREVCAETKSDVERSLKAIANVGTAIETLLGKTPEELAAALGEDTTGLRETLEALASKVNKAKHHAQAATAFATA